MAVVDTVKTLLGVSNNSGDFLRQLKKYSDEANKALVNRRDKWKKLKNYWLNKQLPATRPTFKSDVRVNYAFLITQVKFPIMTETSPTVNFVSFDESDTAQQQAQKLSKLVGNALWNKLRVQETLCNVLFSAGLYDGGFWKIGFDPSVDNGVGEIFVSSIEPFKILPDPFALKIADCRYIIHVEPKALADLKKKYPQAAGQIKTNKEISDILYEGSKFSSRDPRINTYDDKTEFGIERALLKEYWLCPYECDQTIMEDVQVGTDPITQQPITKSLPKYRNGRVVTTVNDEVIVDDKPNPYRHGKFPFVLQKMNIVGNEFWGIGDVEQVVPLLDQLNHAYQQIDDIANQTANIGWTVDPSVGKETVAKLQTALPKPGALKIIPLGMIRPDIPPQIPGYLIRRIDDLKANIRDVSGISDILQGNSRVTHRTARGIERLNENATSRIGQSIRLMEDALREVALQMADIATDPRYYSEARTYAILGSSGMVQGTITVQPGDLSGEYEVSVDSGATLPQDKQSKVDLSFTLLNSGVYAMALGFAPNQVGNNPAALREIAKMVLDRLQYPGRESLLNWRPPAPPAPPQVPGQAGANPLAALLGGGAPPAGGPPPAPVSPIPTAIPPEVQQLAAAAGIPVAELMQLLAQATGK